MKKNEIACYTLKADAKAKFCEWVKNLKFPDGFASNLGRCVDMQKKKLFGMKSHDCHVFMQRLIPIAFRELLPQSVWTALTELSMFFKELTATVISKTDMERLEKDIPVILCKLERIFPPSFFDSMEHLPVHLPFEAKIAGPVQYRWMYPFERYLQKLKNNVKNKNRVEGSIANAYLMEEASSFCSYYFEEHVGTKARNVPRNEDVDEDDREDIISLFRQSGRAFGKKKTRYLTDNEYNAARAYVLLNCDEVSPFNRIYYEHVRRGEPNISDAELDKKAGIEFPEWFKQYVFDPVNNVTNECIKSLAMGPFRLVTMYPAYMVGGYRFRTLGHGTNRATINSGVCIKGTNYNANEYDYYGRLLEVLVLEYSGLPLRTTVLFNVEWFDPTPRGTKLHPRYNLMDINHKRRFNGYEPFVLCTQAEQVCYCTYPSLKQDKVDWWAVFKVRPRSSVPLIESSIPPSFQEETIEAHDPLEVDYDQVILQDPSGAVIELPYELSDTEDDFELDTDSDTEDDIEDDGSEMPHSNQTRGSISGRGDSSGRGSAARQLFGDQTDERVTDLGDQTQSPIHSGDDDDDIPEIPVPARNARKLVCDEDIVDSKVSACMTQIFKKSILPDGYKWKHVRQNKEHMDMYFNEFKKFYRWNEHDEAIKKIFIRHGGRRYSDMLCNMKKNKDRVQSGSIGDEWWALFKAYWDKQDTKDNAAKMAQNRLSEPEGAGTGISKHCGGSRSARGHAMLLKKELGREPTYYELMKKTHVKADKSGFCTEKARRIAEEIKAREIAFQERGEEVDPNEIFMEVVPVKKQRLFGNGWFGSSWVSKNVVSSSSSQRQGESESLRHQLDSLSAQLEEERVLRTQRELEIQEQLANSKREMEESGAALEESLEERVAEATTAMMR
ncbi:hypothetical protein OROMI_002577 [Orobanche minor]